MPLIWRRLMRSWSAAPHFCGVRSRSAMLELRLLLGKKCADAFAAVFGSENLVAESKRGAHGSFLCRIEGHVHGLLAHLQGDVRLGRKSAGHVECRLECFALRHHAVDQPPSEGSLGRYWVSEEHHLLRARLADAARHADRSATSREYAELDFRQRDLITGFANNQI